MALYILYVCMLGTIAPLPSSAVGANGLFPSPREHSGGSSYFYYQDPQYPRDCQEVYDQCEDVTESGIYTIQPDGSPEPFKVYCNNTIDGGKWTVFQRRVDGSVDFYRNWNEYKKGFGFLNREFWLGNDNLAYLTSQKNYELRIDMNDRNGVPYFAKYDLFRISDEWSEYRLVDLGEYSPASTAGNDAFRSLNFVNKTFSTYDNDNDLSLSANCASDIKKSAWWFTRNCAHVNLNGLYFGSIDSSQSIMWYHLTGTGDDFNMQYVEMKIRPRYEY